MVIPMLNMLPFCLPGGMCTLSPSLFTRLIPSRAIKAGAQGISMGSLSRRMIHMEDLYEEFLRPP